LNNTSSSHSGLDPESRKHLITLDTGPPDFARAGLRRYDDIAGWAGFGKALGSRVPPPSTGSGQAEIEDNIPINHQLSTTAP